MVFFNKRRKCFTGQRVALGFGKHIAGNDMQFRHQFNSAGPGLKVPRTGREVVVLNVNDMHTAAVCPSNRPIDIVNNLSVVFCDVILQVNHD